MTIWNELFRLFYPALCVSCGRPLVRGEDQICIRCLSDLPVYHPSAEKHFEQIAAICPFVGSIEIFLRYDFACLRIVNIFFKGARIICRSSALKPQSNIVPAKIALYMKIHRIKMKNEE